MTANNQRSELKTFKVLVVGGGIAGLALAHALQRAKFSNLRVTVYEQRAEETGFGKYPMHLSADARTALQSILAPESYATLTSLSDYGLAHDGITISTPQYTRLFSDQEHVQHVAAGTDAQAEADTAPPAQPQFVHRRVLKQVLADGVDVIRGKRVVRTRNTGCATEGGDGSRGKVEVVFDDGSTELADLVVGADGVGSVLRAQLFPTHARFPLLLYVGVQFKLATSPSSLSLPDKNGMNLVLGTHSNSLLLVPLHGKALPPLTPRAALNATGPFANEDASVHAVQSALEDPGAGYVYGYLTLGAEQGWEDMTEHAWIENILQLLVLEKADPELIRAVEEDIIPSTVGRGAGGAAALQDADALARAILTFAELGGSGSLDTVLPIFVREMVTRSEGYLKDALHRLELTNQSGINAYMRRGLLGALGLCGPLADWVLNRRRESATQAINDQHTLKPVDKD